MTETTLLEPSIADVLKAIEAATDLPASKRNHWSCSLRQICTYLTAHRRSFRPAGRALKRRSTSFTPRELPKRQDARQPQIKRSRRIAVVRGGEEPAEVGGAAYAGLGGPDGQGSRSQSSQTAVRLSEVLLGSEDCPCGCQ